MTVWEFNHRVKGERDRQANEWRRTRWMVGQLLSPHMKKGKALRLTDLMELPGDEPPAKMSPERIKADVERKTRLYLKQRSN